MNNQHNLDEGISEYFSFTLMGGKYLFRYPTMDELKSLVELEKKGEITIEMTQDFYSQFVTKENPKSPEFKDLLGKMTVAHWMAFNNMVKEEMGANENNTSPKAS